MKFIKRCWAEINLDNLERNYNELKARLKPGCRLMAVIKADGYGHGDIQTARLMEELGAQWLGVSNIEEAQALRGAGIGLPILILGYTPPDCAAALARDRLTQTLLGAGYAQELARSARSAGVRVDAHIKVDTGMNRIGFCPQSPADFEALLELGRTKSLGITGIFTHFAAADENGGSAPAFTANQFERFTGLCGRLEAAGMEIGLRHCCNSAGILRYPLMHLDMVRAGISLYGLLPSADCGGDVRPHPVMSLKTVVTMVKTLPAGQPVSYGRTFTSSRAMRVATIAVGYADGYDRAYSNRGRVLVRGEYAPILGRVCMDQSMVDVSRIDGVEPGDVVTLAGADGGSFISMDELAELSGTINYEKVCLVGKRVTRVYLRHGQVAEVEAYKAGGR